MSTQPDPRLDERFNKVPRNTRPTPLDSIHALVERGESPQAVGAADRRIRQ